MTPVSVSAATPSLCAPDR
jgi:hypothetical protein